MALDDDDLQLLRTRPMTSWGEYEREQVARELIVDQAEKLRSMSRQQAADAAKFREELATVRGGMETRLDALSRSFGAFVELDAVRQLLDAYPENAKARRYATTDLHALMMGKAPAERPDVPGYWLPPAVAALRPDGGADEGLAAEAVARSGDARIFLVAARMALGAPGRQFAGSLPVLLAPVDGGWDTKQRLLFDCVVRGAFGPGALAGVASVLRPAATEGGQEATVAWLRDQVGGQDASDASALEWLATRLEEVAPEAAAGDDAAWAMAYQDDPVTTGAEGGEASFQPDSVPSVDDPRRAEQELRAMLLSLAKDVLDDGDEEERDLLTRAEQLRRVVAEPTAAEAALSDDSVPVLDVLRVAALDPRPTRADRRVLWGWLTADLGPWLRGIADAPAPKEPEFEVPGMRGIVARPGGASDEALVRREQRKIEEANAAPAMAANSTALLLGGLAAATISIVVSLAFSHPGWVFLVILSLGVAGYGFWLRKAKESATHLREDRIAQLNRDVGFAVGRAERQHAGEVAAYERVTGAAARVIAARGRLG